MGINKYIQCGAGRGKCALRNESILLILTVFSLLLTFLRTAQNQKCKPNSKAHLLAKLTSHQAQLIHLECKMRFWVYKKRKGEITKDESIYWSLILGFVAYGTIFSKLGFLKPTFKSMISNTGSKFHKLEDFQISKNLLSGAQTDV